MNKMEKNLHMLLIYCYNYYIPKALSFNRQRNYTMTSLNIRIHSALLIIATITIFSVIFFAILSTVLGVPAFILTIIALVGFITITVNFSVMLIDGQTIPEHETTHKSIRTNTMNNFLVFIIALAFIGFIALLIIGMVIKSIPLIVFSFILAFIGYAIAEHDSTH